MTKDRIYYFPPQQETMFIGFHIDLDALIAISDPSDSGGIVLQYQLRSEPLYLNCYWDVLSVKEAHANLVAAWRAYHDRSNCERQQ